MKTIKFLRAIIVLLGILLSACASSAAPVNSADAPANVGGGKAISEVIFTGVIESIDGNQWVIDGQTITVDASVLQDGPFAVGDTVKVAADIAADGSITAQRVETPSASDLAAESPTAAATEPASTPAGAAPQELIFDDGGTEAFGTLETLTDTSITVGGETFTLAPGAEIKGELLPGALVKIHFITNADGTLSVREVELADPSELDDNSNDDNSNDVNGNDDNSNDDNSNDDNGNSNDDDSNDDNSNDDSSDDNGNDDSNDDNGGSDDDNDDDSSDSNHNG